MDLSEKYYYPLSLVLKSLTLLTPFSANELEKQKFLHNFYKLLFLIFINASVFFLLFCCLAIEKILLIGSVFFQRSLWVSYTAYTLLHNRKKVLSFLCDIQNVYNMLETSRKRSIDVVVKRSVMLGWICFLILTVLTIVCLSILPGKKSAYLSDTVAPYLFNITIIAYVLSCNGTLALVPVLLTTFCCDLTRACEEFQQVMKSVRIKNVSDLTRLRMQHLRLRSVAFGMNRNFSTIAFTWYISLLYSVLAETAALVSIPTPGHVMAVVSFYYLPVLALFSHFSFQGCRLNEVFRRLVPVSQGLDVDGDEPEQLCQLLLLQNQLLVPDVGLSLCGCFTVRRKFCLSLVGAIVTYTLVIVQMKPAVRNDPFAVALLEGPGGNFSNWNETDLLQ